MADGKEAGLKLLSAAQLAEVNAELWRTLNIIVGCNNLFVCEMQKSATLGAADQERVRQWSTAVAKAHQQVLDAQERLNAKPAAGALN